MCAIHDSNSASIECQKCGVTLHNTGITTEVSHRTPNPSQSFVQIAFALEQYKLCSNSFCWNCLPEELTIKFKQRNLREKTRCNAEGVFRDTAVILSLKTLAIPVLKMNIGETREGVNLFMDGVYNGCEKSPFWSIPLYSVVKNSVSWVAAPLPFVSTSQGVGSYVAAADHSRDSRSLPLPLFALSCIPPFNTAMGKFCAHLSAAKFSYCAAQRYCRDVAGELLMGKMKKCEKALLTRTSFAFRTNHLSGLFLAGDDKVAAPPSISYYHYESVGLTDALEERATNRALWRWNDGSPQRDSGIFKVGTDYESKLHFEL